MSSIENRGSLNKFAEAFAGPKKFGPASGSDRTTSHKNIQEALTWRPNVSGGKDAFLRPDDFGAIVSSMIDLMGGERTGVSRKATLKNPASNISRVTFKDNELAQQPEMTIVTTRNEVITYAIESNNNGKSVQRSGIAEFPMSDTLADKMYIWDSSHSLVVGSVYEAYKKQDTAEPDKHEVYTRNDSQANKATDVFVREPALTTSRP